MELTMPDDAPEDRWESAALRWVLGLGALAGAWWTVFALLASRALAAGEYGLAAPVVVLGLLPNALWLAAAPGARAPFWLGCLRAAWRRCGRARPARVSARV